MEKWGGNSMYNWQNQQHSTYYPNYYGATPFQSVPNTSQNSYTPYQFYQKPLLPVPQQNNSQMPPFSFGKQTNPMLSYFQDKNGEMDFDKIFKTVNQLANTYQQVSPLVKNVGSIVKSFKGL